MTATIKAAISPFAQTQSEFDSNPMHFLNEDLASVPASGIPEEFRKLSRYGVCGLVKVMHTFWSGVNRNHFNEKPTRTTIRQI
jgi:hypothetical protein